MVQDFRVIVLVPVTLFVTSWESQTPTGEFDMGATEIMTFTRG